MPRQSHNSLLRLQRQSEVRGIKNLPVTSDGLKIAVVSTKGDVESDDGLASLDKVEHALIDAGGDGGLVVEELDLLEETGLVVLVELGAELLLSGEATEACNEASR